MRYFMPPERIKVALRRDGRLGESTARRLNTLHTIRHLMEYVDRTREVQEFNDRNRSEPNGIYR